MVFSNSKIKVADNTGARTIGVIKILKKKPKACATVGNKLIVSIKKDLPKKKRKVTKKGIELAVLIRQTKNILRKDGMALKFDKNNVVLIFKNHQLLGTKIYGPVSKELRKAKMMKVIALATLTL